MNKSIAKKDNNSKSNLHLEGNQHKSKMSFNISEGNNSSQNECIENSSEDKFDWDWIFEKGWLRTKK